jgi:hypothetical protein
MENLEYSGQKKLRKSILACNTSRAYTSLEKQEKNIVNYRETG